MGELSPLLRNDYETNNETRPIVRLQVHNEQQLNFKNEEQYFLCGPCRGVISRTSWELGSVQFSPSVKRRLGDWCEMSASLGVGAIHQLWNIRYTVRTWAEDIVRIRHQETTSEGIEGFMFAAVTVIFRVCKPVRLLSVHVVTTCVVNKSSHQSKPRL
jgi:hypothetical protein